MATYTNKNACINCGTQEIKTKDCGYSSFNPGSATCVKCGREIKVSCCSYSNPDKSLIAQWNKDNPPPQKVIDFIDNKIKELKEEKKRLKKLFKI